MVRRVPDDIALCQTHLMLMEIAARCSRPASRTRAADCLRPRSGAGLLSSKQRLSCASCSLMSSIFKAAASAELATHFPSRAAERVPEQRGAIAVADLQAAESHAAVLRAPTPGATATLIHDLRELFKVKVVGLVLVTGWGGFYLGSLASGISSMQRGLLDALLGIGLVSAGAGALNEVLERKTDACMRRTADRPLAAGRFSLGTGLAAGMGALALGALWLLLHTNLLTAMLAVLTAFTYVAIYTPLKRVTTLATFIGAFPGAMGPLLGWTAARPQIDWQAVALFAILFVWQFPHFMSISWLYREDYARAGIRMLPVVQPDGWSTVVEALFYAVLMIPVSLLPWKLGMTGPAYAVVAALLGLVYLAYTIRFARILKARSETESRMLARDLLKVSVLYLPLLFTALMLCANGKR
jgi:heme o synthase